MSQFQHSANVYEHWCYKAKKEDKDKVTLISPHHLCGLGRRPLICQSHTDRFLPGAFSCTREGKEIHQEPVLPAAWHGNDQGL